MVKIFRKESEFNSQEFFLVTYFLESKNSLREAAWNLAIGQSIGNPNNRSVWETEEMFLNHSCFILADEEELKTKKEGIVKIAFPLFNINLDEDGISQILCHVAGGQVDILEIQKCHVLDIQLPDDVEKSFSLSPAYGITGWRDFNGVHDKPFLGGIIKPKVGMSPEVLLEAVKEMVYGGVNFCILINWEIEI